MRIQLPIIALALLVLFIGPTLAQKPAEPPVDGPLTLTKQDPRKTKTASHWSFKPLERPPVPVHASAWISSPIDAFILSQLDAAKLSPSPPSSVKSLYGLDNDVTRSFGTQCLNARRLVERGVRFVQLYHGGGGDGWDTHGANDAKHLRNGKQIDQPIAGLILDLKARGLLDSTLILWGGEFGRTPTSEGSDGRDHSPYGYSVWMAGGGIKGGTVFGATDDFGFNAVENPVQVRDLHATILHLLGLEHDKLTYYFQGLQQRLTQVDGESRVLRELLA